MTAPRKPDLARGMRHTLHLAEERVDELTALSDADFQRAMAALPPSARVPSLDELLEGAKRKAADRGAADGGAEHVRAWRLDRNSRCRGVGLKARPRCHDAAQGGNRTPDTGDSIRLGLLKTRRRAGDQWAV